MKLPIRFGLIITAGVILWVIISHLLVTNPQSKVHSFGPMIFFNVLQFSVIFLGLRALEREQGEKPTFKQGLKTGVAISLVYALSASVFFIVVLLIVGPKWMQAEPGAQVIPTWLLVIQAFAGLCIFAMLMGLIYSTLISFALAKRISN